MKNKIIPFLILLISLLIYNSVLAELSLDEQGNIIEVPDDYEEPVNYEIVDISKEKNSIIISANQNYEIIVWIYPEKRMDSVIYPWNSEDRMHLPFIDEYNRTQIPLRLISNVFKSSIEWDSETNSATVTSIDGNLFKFTDGSNILTVNGEETIMDTTARLINGKLYVPIRYLDGAMADISFHMFEYTGVRTVIRLKE